MQFGSFSQAARLKPRAQRQVLDVYLTLASTLASSMAGYYTAERLPQFFGSYSLLLVLGIAALALAIFLTPATPRNLSRRRLMVWSMGWLAGTLAEPAIEPLVYAGYRSSVYMALGTAVSLFGSFGVAVMSSSRAQVVYAVGAALFVSSSLSWVSLLNFFYPTAVLTDMTLLGALAVPCVSVVVHTSSMFEQAARGVDLDPVVHALRFFNDLVRMFVYLLELFTTDSRRERDDDRRSHRRRRSHGRRQYFQSSGFGL
ncbi:hypothetical protein GGF46_005273 [Coemansia sp. RSA 552]|nr:hypothetical protein GGF46_005273 [Coemansia sp. RSA 552]